MVHHGRLVPWAGPTGGIHLKLKTLLKTLDCNVVIYHGDYARDTVHEYVGECQTYDDAGIIGVGDNLQERDEAEERIKAVYECNIRQAYINTRGALVVYVK